MIDVPTALSLVSLLLVGAIALQRLRSMLADTRRGRVIFRMALVTFAIACVLAVYGLIRRGRLIRPDPSGEMQVTSLLWPDGRRA